MKLTRTLRITIPEDIELDENEARVLLAIELFCEGRLTIKQAASLADLCVEDFMKELSKRKISIINWTLEELKEELKNAKKLARRL